MFYQHLITFLEQKGWSKRRLAQELQISEGQMSLIFSGHRFPGRELSQRIIKFTGFCPCCGLSVK